MGEISIMVAPRNGKRQVIGVNGLDQDGDSRYIYLSNHDIRAINIKDGDTNIRTLVLRGSCGSGCSNCVCGRYSKKPKGLSLIYRQICRLSCGCVARGGYADIDEILEGL